MSDLQVKKSRQRGDFQIRIFTIDNVEFIIKYTFKILTRVSFNRIEFLSKFHYRDVKHATLLSLKSFL